MNGIVKVCVRCRDNAYIRSFCPLVAYAFILFVLKKTKEFGLEPKRQVSNFIEKQGAALTGSDAAWIIAERSSKSTFDVTE